MRTTTIRELRRETSAVFEWLEQGETVEVQRHGKKVAVLKPPTAVKRKRPDFAAHLKAIYGDKVLAKTATELLKTERGER